MITAHPNPGEKLLSLGAVLLLVLGLASISPSAFASEDDPIPIDISEAPVDSPEQEGTDPVLEQDVPSLTAEQDEEPALNAIVPLAAPLTPPNFAMSSVTTDVRQTAPVTLAVEQLEEVPDDQVLLVQINPAGGTWQTIETTTVGAIRSAGSVVTIPRGHLPSVGYYYVQLSNWGVSPDYYDALVTPLVGINVVHLPVPSLVESDFLVDQASPSDVTLHMSDYESYPDDQRFTVNIGQTDSGWQLVSQPSVAELRANHGAITIPASHFLQPGSYHVEVTTWGSSPNYHPDLIRLGAGIQVADVSAPTLVQSRLFIGETSPSASATLVLTNLSSAIPDDQLFNVQYGPRGQGDGWLPVAQITMGELRAAGGEIVISGDKIAAPGLYDVEITNWGMSPNHYPEIFIRYAEITVGQFPEPQFTESITYTYIDSVPDIQLNLEDLAALPDDQALNLQIGLAGSTSGWEDVGILTLGSLRDSGGVVTIPRSFLRETGVHHVQLTNWGMAPDYYPEVFTTGTGINVVESPLLAFIDEDGEIITAQETPADADATITVAITGYVPAGARLTVTVMDGSTALYTSSPISTTEQLSFTSYSFEIPAEVLRVEDGVPSQELTVVASLELPEAFEGATVTDAELALTVIATSTPTEPSPTPTPEPSQSATPEPGRMPTTGMSPQLLFWSAIGLALAGLGSRKLASR